MPKRSPKQFRQLRARLANNVLGFRQRINLSQSALARRAGIAQQQISAIEAKKGNPTLSTVAILAEALGVAPERLVGRLIRIPLPE